MVHSDINSEVRHFRKLAVESRLNVHQMFWAARSQLKQVRAFDFYNIYLFHTQTPDIDTNTMNVCRIGHLSSFQCSDRFLQFRLVPDEPQLPTIGRLAPLERAYCTPWNGEEIIDLNGMRAGA